MRTAHAKVTAHQVQITDHPPDRKPPPPIKGSDIPGVDIPEIPPLIQIEAAVTRKRPGFPEDEPFVPRQRMSLDDALRAYTINAAYQVRMEHELGSIEVGKRADLVLLGADLFEVDPGSIHQVPVLLTMMDGRVTFDAHS